MRYLLLFLLVLIASPLLAVNYHFELIDSVSIPEFSNYLNHQIVDIDNDQYTEVIITYGNGYFIYDFQEQTLLDSLLSNDGHRIGTVKAYNYNENPELALFAVKGSVLYTKETLTDTLQPLLILDALPYAMEYPSISMHLKDIDNDSIDEFIFVRLGDYLLYADWPRCVEGGEIGTIACYNSTDYSLKWRNNGNYRGLLGMEQAKLCDLDGDNSFEIVGYGMSHIEQTGTYCGDFELYYYFFRLHDHLGNNIITPSYGWCVSALVDEFYNESDGDDIIVFKGGNLLDSAFFTPANYYAIYCISHYNDSLQLAWAFDSYIEQDNLFNISSIPNTFCASNITGSFDLYDGNTGVKTGEIHGLNNGLITEEGYFVESDDSTIQLIQINGNTVYLYELNLVTAVNNESEWPLPKKIELDQNHPNPFNMTTQIEYTMASRNNVTISIFNLLGQKIKTVIDESKPAGNHTVTWDGTDDTGHDVATGIYFYKLSAGDFTASKKMLLLK